MSDDETNRTQRNLSFFSIRGLPRRATLESRFDRIASFRRKEGNVFETL